MPVVNIRSGEPYDVYIGRAGHGKLGYFGNPIRPGTECFVCGEIHRKGETLTCFRSYVEQRIAVDLPYRWAVAALHGQTLGCFCKPHPCHGDVLEDIARRLKNED